MRLRNVLFACYVAICALAVTWPGYALIGNRVEPFILGLPFVFFWTILWVVLTFFALVLYHVTGEDPA